MSWKRADCCSRVLVRATRLPPLRCWPQICIVIAAASSAHAADFRIVSDVPIKAEVRASHQCSASLSGTIELGDAQKVADYVAKMAPFFDPGSELPEHYESYVGDGLTLCVSGPGGNYSEALRIIDVLSEGHVMTVVPEGAQCLSACAVAFMGGLYADESGEVPGRALRPGADIGFHAPSIALSSEGLIPVQMVEVAYKAALADIHGVLATLLINSVHSNDARMKPSLFTAMLGTAPDAMYHVATIDEIGRWSIELDDGPNDSLNLSQANLIQVCRNLARWRNDHTSQSTKDLRYTNPSGYVQINRIENTSPYSKDELWRYILADEMFTTECTFHIPPGLKRISDHSVQVEVYSEDTQIRENYWPSTWEYLNPETTLKEASARGRSPK